MKNTEQKDKDFTDRIASALKIKFTDKELSLDGWGHADNYVFLDNNKLLIAEIEIGQKHPTTNILKLWPFLENNPKLSIFLIHVLTNENNVSKNRLKICHFLGDKLEKLYPKRFRYYYVNGTLDKETISGIKTKLAEL